VSIREVTMYRVECDWPDCGASAQDDSEYFAWSDKDDAVQYAVDADWRVSRHGVCHYCPDHPTVWASDRPGVEAFSPAPFLVIHDGDTGDADDDGHVSYVGEA
jgi:hypothetical protein